MKVTIDENDNADIHIDSFDVWNCDSTLSYIIVPLLERYMQDDHGYFFVDNVDVPEHLQSEHDGWLNDDENSKARYSWVMNEILWAMKQIRDDEEESPDAPEWFLESFGINTNLSKEHEIERKEWSDACVMYEERILNGCRLFGKYFRHFWT